MTQTNAELLQDIVAVARDGADFYDTARSHVDDARLKETFARLAGHKRDLMVALGGRLEMIGEDVPGSGTVAGSLRRYYAELLAAVSSNDAAVYVAQLEAAEDRLLARMREAIDACDNAEIRSQLQAHLPMVRACHDEMRALTRRLAA
jgi:uncharacterized protein (TIGR02284 family)